MIRFCFRESINLFCFFGLLPLICCCRQHPKRLALGLSEFHVDDAAASHENKKSILYYVIVIVNPILFFSCSCPFMPLKRKTQSWCSFAVSAENDNEGTLRTTKERRVERRVERRRKDIILESRKNGEKCLKVARSVKN